MGADSEPVIPGVTFDPHMCCPRTATRAGSFAMLPAMQQLLYSELVDWYPLLDPPEEHAVEVEVFRQAFDRVTNSCGRSLLELGSGAGHNAWHLQGHYECTLTDISPEMLGLSRKRNPNFEHQVGDMRSLRLGRVFDAVLVHDAIVYMTSEHDLRAAMLTAFEHLRPGGAAIFTPDDLRESFEPSTVLIEGEDGDRQLRCLEWNWDPDPADTCYRAEWALLLREGDRMRAVHDHHIVGLFPRATWIRLLEDVGFRVELLRRPIGGGESDEVFLCQRPLG